MAYGLRYRVRMRRIARILRFAAALAVTSWPATPLAQTPVDTTAAAVREPAERQLRLEAVRITGNERMSDDLIRTHLGLAPGDAVDLAAFEAARVRLLDTGYFTQVDFSTRPGSERGNVTLVIEVVERGPASFETGFGYDDVHGWFLTLLGMRSDTPFGTDSRMRLGLRLGFRIAGVDAEWTQTVSPNRPFGLGARIHLYNENHLFFGSGPPGWSDDGWNRFQQDISRVGGEVFVRYRTAQTSRIDVGVRGETVEPDSGFTDQSDDEQPIRLYPQLPPSLQTAVGKAAINGFFLRYLRDTRDYANYPRRGSYTRLTFIGNTEVLASDEIFTKTTLDASKHVGLGDRSVLSGRVSGGFISDTAPYYERFHIGGIYSIRGFEEWSLSPTDGDDAFWVVNAELRFPLTFSDRTTQPRLTGILFFDAGQGWQNDEVVRGDDIQSAIGYGVRLRLPWLGTLGLDAAVPLTQGNTNDAFRVHPSFGFSF
jgi:outer membrane protein assembly factor BamA